MATPRKKVLIVDPANSNYLFSSLCGDERIDVACPRDRLDLTSVTGESDPDVVLIDASMESASALALLRELRTQVRVVPCLVITAAGSVSTAVAAMKFGAHEVVEKSISPVELLSVLHKIIHESAVSSAPIQRDKTSRTSVSGDFGSMAGTSPAMQGLFATIDQIAGRDTTVLITGESGTGKELVAREIHSRSARRDKPFVAINCAAIPETLIESELFGHEKGAFTNAVERKLGQIELAHGGTLFLDEIGDLSLAVQVKLLRFLQEQEFYRVGRTKPIHVDLRVLTATNRDLDDAVREKAFRQDLLYRINVLSIHLPPLRARKEDIPRLVAHCLRKLSPRYGGRVLRFSPQALTCLCAYPWPGNVRELENVVEGLLALSSSDDIDESSLPSKIRDKRTLQPSHLHTEQFDASGLAFGEAERIFETDMIVRALQKSDYVQTRAAQLLGITRRILKYKMDKLGISDKGDVASSNPNKTDQHEH